MGYLLKFKQYGLILNPGQIIRGMLLIILIAVFFYDIQNKIDSLGRYFLALVIFALLFIVLFYTCTASPVLTLNEIAYLSRIVFILLLMYYVAKHNEYFLERIDRIIFFNFLIFSSSIIFSYFTGTGLNTYSYVESSSKGMFYGGNPVSLLCLVFLIYFLYNFQLKTKNHLYLYGNIFFIFVSVLNIHIISTKATMVVPVIFFVYFIYSISEMNLSSKIIGCFTILSIIFFSYLFIKPIVVENYEDRYGKVIERAYNHYQKNERIFNSPITAPLEMIANRRVMAAKQQTKYLLKNPQFLILGVGHTNQVEFWENLEMTFHDASMDMFDVLFTYGILGSVTIFILIIKIFFFLVLDKRIDRNAVVIFTMFLYSFFGGHVINTSTSGTMMALFVGIEYSRYKNKHILLDNLKWLKH